MGITTQMTDAQLRVYGTVRNLACGATLHQMQQARQVALDHNNAWLAECWALLIAEYEAE